MAHPHSPESPLVAVNFHLYKPCNEHCRYCFATFPDIRGRLTDDEADALVRTLARHGTRKLTFVGGEPTLHPALPRLITTARDVRMTTALVTNGARLERVLQACPGALDWVGLSVDSADEEVQRRLGRGDGSYVAAAIAHFARLHALGIRTKLNTVVTALNWREDMSSLVRRVHPERWKVFQVLPIAGQNDGRVEPLLITRAEFEAFVARHAVLAADGLGPVPEDNEAMTGSYLMVDPLGRFFDNVDGRLRYSRPILEVGVETALTEVRFEVVRLVARGGVYSW
jgi:radical S-adenosyl methionine domain-containing protein 2